MIDASSRDCLSVRARQVIAPIARGVLSRVFHGIGQEEVGGQPGHGAATNGGSSRQQHHLKELQKKKTDDNRYPNWPLIPRAHPRGVMSFFSGLFKGSDHPIGKTLNFGPYKVTILKLIAEGMQLRSRRRYEISLSIYLLCPLTGLLRRWIWIRLSCA